jgi:hypothetical protein
LRPSDCGKLDAFTSGNDLSAGIFQPLPIRRDAMNGITKLILAASALLLSGELAAQTFKCTNAAGKITYSGMKCSELGLKDAGEVKDRLNVNPAYRPPAPANRPPLQSAPAAAPEAPNTGAPAAAAEPANPERRCFTVHTAKGNVTRCSDKSDEQP